MNKYKNLIVLLVVFGTIQLIFTGAISPKISKWLVGQAFENNSSSDQLSYMVAILRFADVIIWVPVSIWIYKDSKKTMFGPWLWAVLTLVAHYQALIIYLLIQVIMEKEKAELKTPNIGVDSDAANPAAQVTP